MFLAQTTLEAWLESGKADFSGSVVTLKEHHKTYELAPAVRVLSVIAGGTSPLVGKVLPEQRILDAGGELLEDSVVFGEIAFQVAPGYIATQVSGQSAMVGAATLVDGEQKPPTRPPSRAGRRMGD
jgi:hypothetical protein